MAHASKVVSKPWSCSFAGCARPSAIADDDENINSCDARMREARLAILLPFSTVTRSRSAELHALRLDIPPKYMTTFADIRRESEMCAQCRAYTPSDCMRATGWRSMPTTVGVQPLFEDCCNLSKRYEPMYPEAPTIRIDGQPAA